MYTDIREDQREVGGETINQITCMILYAMVKRLEKYMIVMVTIPRLYSGNQSTAHVRETHASVHSPLLSLCQRSNALTVDPVT